MKLVKALKEKNKLVGEINRLRSIIGRENSREALNTSKIDRVAMLDLHESAVLNLIKLKAAIAKANIGIYEQIETMKELKSYITWITNLNTVDGIVESPSYNSKPIIHTYNAHIKQEDVDKIVKDHQEKIAGYQDVVDEYNATTNVEI